MTAPLPAKAAAMSGSYEWPARRCTALIAESGPRPREYLSPSSVSTATRLAGVIASPARLGERGGDGRVESQLNGQQAAKLAMLGHVVCEECQGFHEPVQHRPLLRLGPAGPELLAEHRHHLALVAAGKRRKPRAHCNLVAHRPRGNVRGDGAAQVLQQRDVVDLVDFLVRETEQVGGLGREQAAAQGVLERKPGAEVGGERQ